MEADFIFSPNQGAIVDSLLLLPLHQLDMDVILGTVERTVNRKLSIHHPASTSCLSFGYL